MPNKKYIGIQFDKLQGRLGDSEFQCVANVDISEFWYFFSFFFNYDMK